MATDSAHRSMKKGTRRARPAAPRERRATPPQQLESSHVVDLEGDLEQEPPALAATDLPAHPTSQEPPIDPVEEALADVESAWNLELAEAALRRLGQALRGADGLRQAVIREQAIKALNSWVSAPAKLVDAALTPPGSGSSPPDVGQGRPVAFENLERWPEAVEGRELLQELAEALTRYVRLPPHSEVATALWVVHTHALDAAETCPILALTSPEKRCGKTRMLSLLHHLVRRPLTLSNITPAALFRAIEKFSPTLLMDEGDAFLASREELRGVLDSGHTRQTAYVLRTTGDDYEPRQFSTWGAKAVALIGRLPDTLEDRSIIIPMHRRAAGEFIERLRLDQPGAFVGLHRRVARWAADHVAELRAVDPAVPGELGDRAADNWRPLLAIADRAGGDWPRLARQAALALSGKMDPEDGAREQLLGDIRAIFVHREVGRLFTEQLLADLCEREDRPWREWRAGKRLSAISLARLLKPFEIRPRSIREGDATGKGYEQSGFAEAFKRYLPADPSQPSQPNASAGLREDASRHGADSVTGRQSGSNPYGEAVVTAVTVEDLES